MISKYILNSVIDIDTDESEKNVDIRIHLHFVYFLIIIYTSVLDYSLREKVKLRDIQDILQKKNKKMRCGLNITLTFNFDIY